MAESNIRHESGTYAIMPLELGRVVQSDHLVCVIKGLSNANANCMDTMKTEFNRLRVCRFVSGSQMKITTRAIMLRSQKNTNPPVKINDVNIHGKYYESATELDAVAEMRHATSIYNA